jgi:hypothetical protein
MYFVQVFYMHGFEFFVSFKFEFFCKYFVLMVSNFSKYYIRIFW